MRKKVVIGQKLYSLNINNAARGVEQKLTEVTVVKVGRKYFTVQVSNQSFARAQYHIDTWREVTDYTPDHQLFETVQEYEDSIERTRLRNTIRKIFGGFGANSLPLDSLRKIDAIIKESLPPDNKND